MKRPSFSLALLCLVFFNKESTAQCVPAGPFGVSTFSNNTSIGTVVWNTLNDVLLADNNYAISTQVLGILSTANTNYIQVGGLGFSIPAGSTICGITVSVERSSAGLGVGCVVQDADVRIVKNGVLTGTNHASNASWGSIDAVATYGGAADMWGTTWMSADINSAGFGVAIAASMQTGLVGLALSARIDYISVTVHYASPTTLPLRPREATVQATAPVRNIGFYPNPAGNAIYITGRRKTATITIKDLEGRIVKRVSIGPDIRLPQVSLVDVNPGLYLLEIDNTVFRLNVAR
ncbi:MAG: T9SS type A sorting domain-containing protein [Niastella sp.]|nr:T9SS type A sorting domain-containing protein [Niastella sp.]